MQHYEKLNFSYMICMSSDWKSCENLPNLQMYSQNWHILNKQDGRWRSMCTEITFLYSWSPVLIWTSTVTTWSLDSDVTDVNFLTTHTHIPLPSMYLQNQIKDWPILIRNQYNLNKQDNIWVYYRSCMLALYTQGCSNLKSFRSLEKVNNDKNLT